MKINNPLENVIFEAVGLWYRIMPCMKYIHFIHSTSTAHFSCRSRCFKASEPSLFYQASLCFRHTCCWWPGVQPDYHGNGITTSEVFNRPSISHQQQLHHISCSSIIGGIPCAWLQRVRILPAYQPIVAGGAALHEPTGSQYRDAGLHRQAEVQGRLLSGHIPCHSILTLPHQHAFIPRLLSCQWLCSLSQCQTHH